MPAIQLRKSWPDRIRLGLCIFVFGDVTLCRWVLGVFMEVILLWTHQTLKMKAVLSFETSGNTERRSATSRKTRILGSTVVET
jgi:hypothetical protein